MPSENRCSSCKTHIWKIIRHSLNKYFISKPHATSTSSALNAKSNSNAGMIYEANSVVARNLENRIYVMRLFLALGGK